MNNKVLTLLGFAAKAGKLSYGFDSTHTAIKQKKSKIIICAEDLSQKSVKEIIFYASKTEIQVFSLKGVAIETLSKSVGRKCGMVSVNDKGFAESLKEEILNDQQI